MCIKLASTYAIVTEAKLRNYLMIWRGVVPAEHDGGVPSVSLAHALSFQFIHQNSFVIHFAI